MEAITETDEEKERSYQFIHETTTNNLHEDIQCPICFGLLKNAVCTTCKHTFCKECILIYLSRKWEENRCPICKKPITKRELRPNLNIQMNVKMYLENIKDEEMEGESTENSNAPGVRSPNNDDLSSVRVAGMHMHKRPPPLPEYMKNRRSKSKRKYSEFRGENDPDIGGDSKRMKTYTTMADSEIIEIPDRVNGSKELDQLSPQIPPQTPHNIVKIRENKKKLGIISKSSNANIESWRMEESNSDGVDMGITQFRLPSKNTMGRNCPGCLQGVQDEKYKIIDVFGPKYTNTGLVRSLAITGILRADRKEIRSWCSNYGISYCMSVNACCDVLIVKVNRDGSYLLTIKTLQAILQGVHIVSLQWIIDSGSFMEQLPVEYYTIVSENKLPNMYPSGILKGYTFHLEGSFGGELPKRDEIIELIKSGGGIVTQSLPVKLFSTILTAENAREIENGRETIVLCGNLGEEERNSEFMRKFFTGGLKIVRCNWLLDSLAKFFDGVLGFEDYLLHL